MYNKVIIKCNTVGGDRTHADKSPEDLKSPALTTRPQRLLLNII